MMMLTVIIYVGFTVGCQAALLLCLNRGSGSLTRYDNETQKCEEGIVVSKITTIPTTTVPSSTLNITQYTSTIISPYLNRLCELGYNLPEGYQCCGYISYKPDFQTCCGITWTKTVVHSGKPDREYTCCRDDITKPYKRNALPCTYHPANNDKFWKAPGVSALLKSPILMKEACRTKTAYFGPVEFDNTTLTINSDLIIRLNKLDLKSPTSQQRNTEMSLYIEKDRHRSNPSKLDGKYFLIVTENQQPTEIPSYINVQNDYCKVKNVRIHANLRNRDVYPGPGSLEYDCI